jgi:hypothetical protein
MESNVALAMTCLLLLVMFATAIVMIWLLNSLGRPKKQPDESILPDRGKGL